MRRRDLIGALSGCAMAGAWPSSAGAEQRKVQLIGMLETISTAQNRANLDAFRKGLQELGYADGQDFVIEYRSADGHAERFPDLAAELVHLGVDLIVTRGTPAALAARDATQRTPIVMAAIGEPLGSGVVADLARPGENVTGLSAFTTELQGKRVELIREMVPAATRIATLLNMGNPVVPPQWEETKKAAAALGMHAQLLDVRRFEDLGDAFAAAISEHAQALVVGIDALIQAHRGAIADFAGRYRLPAIYPSKEFVDAGGLLAYGVSYPDLYHRAAGLVDKILKGAKPGELPVQHPAKLVINLKTAKALGLTIPPTLLARADEVIE